MRAAFPWLLVVIGLLLSTVAFETTRRDEIHRMEQKFRQIALDRVKALEHQIDNEFQVLRGIKAFHSIGHPHPSILTSIASAHSSNRSRRERKAPTHRRGSPGYRAPISPRSRE